MNYLKLSIGILIVLSASRFIPHPPNFTSLIALSFYVPAFFGVKYIPAVMISFLITDIYFGFHDTQFFTWGSIFLIGYLSKFLFKNLKYRFIGAVSGSIIFFVITNFGVFVSGSYGYSFDGFVTCYILAIPFFGNTLISTIVYSIILESLNKIFIQKKSLLNNHR